MDAPGCARQGDRPPGLRMLDGSDGAPAGHLTISASGAPARLSPRRSGHGC